MQCFVKDPRLLFQGDTTRLAEVLNPGLETAPSSSFGILPSRGHSHLVSNPEFHSLRNLTQRGLQRVGNLPQPAHRRVDDSSLNPADVRSVEAAVAAEALLRLARKFTEFTHDRADCSYLQIGRLDLLVAPLHPQIRWCYVEAYKPTAYTPHLLSADSARALRNWSRMSPSPSRMLYS